MGMCLPGMKCFENTSNQECVTVYTYYPTGCQDPTATEILTSNIIYNGPNLPNSGIQTGDTLSTIFEKIDAAL